MLDLLDEEDVLDDDQAEEQRDKALDVLDRLKVRDLAVKALGIARKRGATLLEVCGTARDNHIKLARVEVWRWLQSLGWSYSSIGKLWGHDHSTIYGALRRTKRKRRAVPS
jgi:hypothetical protein